MNIMLGLKEEKNKTLKEIYHNTNKKWKEIGTSEEIIAYRAQEMEEKIEILHQSL